MVENGSTDSTLVDARRFAADDDAVVVLTRPVADYGEAMRAGILAARGDVVVVFDVDYFDPAFVDVVLPRLAAPDGPAIVVGLQAGAGDARHAPVAAPCDHRRVLDRAAHRLRSPRCRTRTG